MNIIFLDFDGVLNDFYPCKNEDYWTEEMKDREKRKRKCRNFIGKTLDKYPKSKIKHYLINATQQLDVEKVLLLNRLMDRTDANTV